MGHLCIIQSICVEAFSVVNPPGHRLWDLLGTDLSGESLGVGMVTGCQSQ